MTPALTVKELVNDQARRFATLLSAYKECSPDVQRIVDEMSAIVIDESMDIDDRNQAVDVLIEALFPGITAGVIEFHDDTLQSSKAKEAREELVRQEETFASNVKKFMDEKGLSQEDLAKRTGVGQPAISNILNRNCRPQQRTIARFAEALGVDPSELWPEGSDG